MTFGDGRDLYDSISQAVIREGVQRYTIPSWTAPTPKEDGLHRIQGMSRNLGLPGVVIV